MKDQGKRLLHEEPTALTVTVKTPGPPAVEEFVLGTAHSPDGTAITVGSGSLRRNGQPWLPVMGEFHYSRYPETEWRRELLRMRAGGIDIVATYVFWIHHEEQEGVWDWSGRRDLREFVRLCGEVGMLAVVRLGPWCHGEVRNGGFPDWLLAACGDEVRTDGADYLRYSRLLFAQAAAQLAGLLWKNGGPVIGVQVENEYGGPAEHLISLKQLAQEAGFDVPLYTRTGWPDLATSMPTGALMPLFGGYPDGFWDRSIAEMPRGYQGAYLFTHIRADAAIATDQLGERTVTETPDDALYPYFACEIGGGMLPSYHRRIRIAPLDIAALGLVKLGSGNNLQGYYMYHGGTNPDGLLSTLQESQATGYWNDVPTKSYDFQAPLGEFGQVREHYHRLRLLHLMLRDFGPALAAMPSVLPDALPADASDTKTLRWAVRSDGRSGMIFVSNYQRLQPMPAKEEVQFHLCLPEACLSVPAAPASIPTDSAFVWPFGVDIGSGLKLTYATAQPICRLETPKRDYAVFAQTLGVPSEFLFEGDGWAVTETTGQLSGLHVSDVQPGTGAAIWLRGPDAAAFCVILLDPEQSLHVWKETLAGGERLLLSPAALIADGGQLSLSAADPTDLHVSVLPPLRSVLQEGDAADVSGNGLFQRFSAKRLEAEVFEAKWEQVQDAGPARQIQLGGEGVAEAPIEADFEGAAVWKVEIPALPEGRRFRLRVRYAGDVARLYFEGRLLTDNFYNGTAFELGLAGVSSGSQPQELLLKILPLRSDAPFYLPGDAWPDFQGKDSAVRLRGMEIIEEHEVSFDTAD